MLAHLCISDYTIISRLEIDFEPGMTVITGETGAGKSIMLDALGLCLGDRAESSAVRPGAKRSEITATFDITDVPEAREWLAARDLDNDSECLLRRVITPEGRSRAYINGTTTTVQDCSALGRLLIDIHSQHAHQSLLRRDVQRELLDAYGGHRQVLEDVSRLAREWAIRHRELQELAGAGNEPDEKRQLLDYQVQELDALALRANELEDLEEEQRILENSGEILRSAHDALQICSEQEDGLRRALKLMSQDFHARGAGSAARELLESVVIQLDEAGAEIQRHIDSVNTDPQRLDAVQERLGSIYDLARKHRAQPEDLPAVHEQLRQELSDLENCQTRIATLHEELESLQASYAKAAADLTRQRKGAAKKLIAGVCKQLDQLAMGQARFEVQIKPREDGQPHPWGQEDIAFLIATNPGAEPQPLSRVASGGELSRISLAVQVVAASAGTVPSMVFDEVDVGVGGAVAEVVGRLLRALSQRCQVLCVTHLPQVAAQGEHHLQISKTVDGKSANVAMRPLSGPEQIDEVARMLGGIRITDQTRAHAEEMIAAAG